MRTKIFVANWKMNHSLSSSQEYMNQFKHQLKCNDNTHIIICPPSLYISMLSNYFKNDNRISLGAQNIHYGTYGAFTGEISSKMLKDFNVNYVIIGHSERRHIFGEDNNIINLKIKSALQNNINVIFCIGETENQYINGETLEIINKQLIEGLSDIENNDILKIIIAYEPVWAIGTGRIPKINDINEIHTFIRQFVCDNYSKDVSDKISIIYGGSTNPDNIKEIMSCPNIDGSIVGGASLNVESFQKIYNS